MTTDALPGISPGAAARRLGIAVTTLRTWHQRYGLGPSDYVRHRHRRYTESDMLRLVAMLRLTAEGLPAAQAARIVLAHADSAAAPTNTDGPGTDTDGLRANTDGPGANTAGNATARDGGGTAIPVGRAGPGPRGLGRAAMRLDADAMTRLLTTSIDTNGVVHTWDRLIRPVLSGLARHRPASDSLIDVEHLLSRSVSTALATVTGTPDLPSRTLLACADEEQHTLPLEALAAALAESGCRARMLGARVPSAALMQAVRRIAPAVVVVWSQTPDTADPAQLEPLRSARPRPILIAAAGPGWDSATLPDVVSRPSNLAEALASTLLTAGADVR